MEEIVTKIFEKKTKQTVLSITRMEGLSNYVFKVTDKSDTNYIFKILVSDNSDPFKLGERHCLQFIYNIYPKPIWENSKYRIENCIHCLPPRLEEIMDPNNQLLVLRSIAKFNKQDKIKSNKPNLFFILEKHQFELENSIREKMLLMNPEKKMRCEKQLVRIQRLLNSLQNYFNFEEQILSHNDLFFRNILFDQQRKVFQLIDFEYVGYNPFGMDIFHFINEWLVDYNYPQEPFYKLSLENYPGDDQIRLMIHFYLFFYKHADLIEGFEENAKLLEFVRTTKEFSLITQTEISAIFDLFPYFGIITNVYWYYWALRIFKLEGINFDYAEFANSKFEMVANFVRQFNCPTISKAFEE